VIAFLCFGWRRKRVCESLPIDEWVWNEYENRIWLWGRRKIRNQVQRYKELKWDFQKRDSNWAWDLIGELKSLCVLSRWSHWCDLFQKCHFFISKTKQPQHSSSKRQPTQVSSQIKSFWKSVSNDSSLHFWADSFGKSWPLKELL